MYIGSLGVFLTYVKINIDSQFLIFDIHQMVNTRSILFLLKN
jgi:hypothetical protein